MQILKLWRINDITTDVDFTFKQNVIQITWHYIKAVSIFHTFFLKVYILKNKISINLLMADILLQYIPVYKFSFPCVMLTAWVRSCFGSGVPSPCRTNDVKNLCVFSAESWKWLNIQIPALKMDAEVVSSIHTKLWGCFVGFLFFSPQMSSQGFDCFYVFSQVTKISG